MSGGSAMAGICRARSGKPRDVHDLAAQPILWLSAPEVTASAGT